MDEILDEIVKLGSRMKRVYKKGTGAAKKDLSGMAAELGISLIKSSKKIAALEGEKLKTELDKVQREVDKFRKLVFEKKIRKS